MKINNILFLHIPQNLSSKSSFIQAAPMGLIGMAHYVKDYAGVNVKIMNLGGITTKYNKVDIQQYILNCGFDLIMLDIQWHQQLHDVLGMIKLLKTDSNWIGVGGITASAFKKELLEKEEKIDFLIFGEGEEPLLKLIEAMNNANGFENVPNLVWRSPDGKIIINRNVFVADDIFLNRLNDWDLSIYDENASYCGKIKKNQDCSDFFFVPIGRGCMKKCSYCGGSQDSFKINFMRTKTTYRKPEIVARTIINVYRYFKIDHFYICYDIEEIPEEWWIELFEIIRESSIYVGLFFEAYRIPSERFMKSFLMTFQHDKSQLILSPTCFSDLSRNKFSSVRYSLEDVESFLRKVDKSLAVYLYFSLIPTRDEVDVLNIIDNIKWCKDILEKCLNVNICVSPIVLEPNSPWDIEPEKYGIRKKLKSLEDYIENSNLENKDAMHLGYSFKNYQLITSLYNAVTTRKQLSNLRVENCCLVNNPSEIMSIPNNKTIIINSYDYNQYIDKLFLHCVGLNNNNYKLIFRELVAFSDVIKNIKYENIYGLSFVAVPISTTKKISDCLDFFTELNSHINNDNCNKQILKILFFYANFLLLYQLMALRYNLEANKGWIYLPNSEANSIFPVGIKNENTLKLYVASFPVCFIKKIDIQSFISMYSKLDARG